MMPKRYRQYARALLLVCALDIGFVIAGGVPVAPVPVFAPNSQPTGWVGEVDVNTYNFSDGRGVMFKSDFEKATWSGNLWAYPVDPYGTVLAAASIWEAQEQLAAQNYNTGRYIFTMKKDGSTIPFRWTSLDTTQQSKLGNATNGPKVLDYVRGDRTNESAPGTFRKRASVLGDIIHSRPLFVDDANNPMVYVGANDGMLHAFDANTGDEVWAYVPSMLIPNLPLLTASPYTHQYFVDGTPNASLVTIGKAKKTILVGGLGAGGKGLYALDITKPTAGSEAAAANKLLWEITDSTINNASNSSYADLGYTYGVPLIVQLNNGNYAAIVGNGYNNNNGHGDAVLYVIDIMTGTLVKALKTARVTGAADAYPNGLSSPAALDVDGDGKVDYVYAGDIAGNLWKFDLRSPTPSSWPAPLKIFGSALAMPHTQAITGAPSIAVNPGGGYMLLFGTGRIFTETGCGYTTPACDRTDTTQQYAYGLWDQDFPAAGTAISKVIDPTKVVSQSMSAKVNYADNGVSAVVRTSASINAVDYTPGTGQKQGWRLALANTGERVVGDGGFVSDQRFHFATSFPNYNNGAGNPLGDSWTVEVNYLTGVAPSAPFFDLNLDGQLDDSDRITAGGKPDLTQTGIPIARRIVAGGVTSQPLLASLAKQSQTYFNWNFDATTTPPPTSGGDPGVANGHFDFDIYFNACSLSGTSYSCPRNTHVHQYDDKYNVTGVNMLAPSLAAFNIANAIPANATKFKVIMANQFYSPAVQFKVGGPSATYVPVWKFQTPQSGSAIPALTSHSSIQPGDFSAWLPTYDRTSLLSLVLNMPVDAFTEKKWDGVHSMVGLIPTATGCVHSNKGAPAGLWMNAALTIQVIKDTTPDSAIEPNDTKAAHDLNFGYRLKTDATSQSYQLAQYTMFWHHPNGKCYGDVGWGNTAAIAYPAAPGNPSSFTAAPGSADPTGGNFGSGGGGSGSGGSGGAGGAGSGGTTTTTTVTLGDGSTVTQTVTVASDGTTTVTITDSKGAITSYTAPPANGGRQKDTRLKSGRLSWKQPVRP